MIGVIANPSEHEIVREFFEMFKTPWEFYRGGRQYEVVLSAGKGEFDRNAAKLILIYAGQPLPSDVEEEIGTAARQKNRVLSYKGSQVPIYGDSVTFPGHGTGVLVDEESKQAAIHQRQLPNGELTRIGYNLFSEIDALLTVGQPAEHASIPALDLHIALLRDLIVQSGIPLVEIPPAPDGYPFIACLTHDVDHPSIRRHKWDHTIFGFLYRAVFGSLANVLRRRISIHNLLKNWAVALKLPLVYMGFADDFWSGFEDRYLEVEKGLGSTFFIIPFKDRAGKTSHGAAPRRRAARYGAREIPDAIGKILAAGREVGLHGIDAWLDSATGREELEEIRRLTEAPEIGVRMHWLYYDRQSPAVLERAGAAYDSTVGYNETVGYRAGTTQAYKPLLVDRLLELPLHVMDTALFYPTYLGLSPRKATTILKRLTDNVVHFGGCMTINWHDRSLAPERLWSACYCELVQDLKDRGAWFATAGQAVAWFRKRRSVVFETDGAESNVVRARITARVTAHDGNSIPGLRLRTYHAQEPPAAAARGSERYIDMAIGESVDLRVPCGVSG